MLTERYILDHQYEMIRSRLRLIGRLFVAVKTIKPDITDFTSMYDPENYDDFISAVRNGARYNKQNNRFGAPSVATELGTQVKRIGKILISDCIKNHDKDRKENVENFLLLLDENYTTSINKIAQETVTVKKRNKTVKLPSTSDIQRLNDYLIREEKVTYERLFAKYSYDDWLHLSKISLTSLQIFNRRRAGEIERVLIEDFNKYQGLDKNTYGDGYDELTENMKSVAKRYLRFEIRGKLGRTVPVLFTTNMLQSIQLLLNHRKNAGVPKKNPYLFGIPSTQMHFKYLRSCELMREFSVACGAECPDTLRGTELRKHIATQCGLLQISGNKLDIVADFMGHNVNIHKSHYRKSAAVNDILVMTNLLEIARGDKTKANESEYKDIPEKKSTATQEKCDKSDESDKCNSDDDDYNTSVKATKNKSRKRRSDTEHNSTRKEIKRKRWSEEEKDAVLCRFRAKLKKSILPSVSEIKKLIKENEVMRNRKPEQIKTWMHNIITKKCKNIVI